MKFKIQKPEDSIPILYKCILWYTYPLINSILTFYLTLTWKSQRRHLYKIEEVTIK